MKGLELKEKAKKCLISLYEENPGNFKYVESELSRKSGVSRVTLSRWKREGVIDNWIQALPGTLKANRDSRELLRKEIIKLQQQNNVLIAQIVSLQNHICDVYRHLSSHSVQAKIFIEPILQTLSEQRGRCIFCDHPIAASAD